MHLIIPYILILTLFIVREASAFTAPILNSGINRVRQRCNLKASTEIFEGIRAPVENYVNIWVPLFNQVDIPQLVLHWVHGSAMLTVLLAMGGIGSFLGWQVRLGNGSDEYWFTLGKTAREQHPLIMGLATLFFLAGGQGGLVLLMTQGKDILHSDHAVTALAGLSLLAIQV